MKILILIFLIFNLKVFYCQEKSTSAFVTGGIKYENTTNVFPIKTKKINNKYFNLSFTLRVLPDNTWYLNLKKDSTYTYNHWSDWNDDNQKPIDSGIYKIENNLIIFNSKNKESDFSLRKYFIFRVKRKNRKKYTTWIFNEKENYCLTDSPVLYITNNKLKNNILKKHIKSNLNLCEFAKNNLDYKISAHNKLDDIICEDIFNSKNIIVKMIRYKREEDKRYYYFFNNEFYHLTNDYNYKKNQIKFLKIFYRKRIITKEELKKLKKLFN